MPHIGAASQAFIRRHINELAPGGTVVVAERVADNYWSVECPLLLIDSFKFQSSARAYGVRPVNNQSRTGQPTKFDSTVGPGRRAWRAARGTWNYLKEVHTAYKVESFLKKHSVSVVMAEFLNTAVEWVGLCRQWGIRFFAHAHGYDVSRLLGEDSWRRLYLGYNDGAEIIVVSKHQETRLLEIGIDAERLHIVPYGVDVRQEFPKVTGGHSAVRCLAVGRLVPKKAPLLCLDAFRQAAENVSGLHLDYVGDGPLLPEVLEMLQSFGLQDKVTVHGAVSHSSVCDLMRRSDVFLQHSITDPATGDEEGLPVSILEAMAFGLPVISTKHAGIPEAVVDGVSGFLVEQGDIRAMAQKLMLLATNSDMRLRMGYEGWKRASERYSADRERRSLLSLFGPLDLPAHGPQRAHGQTS